MAWPRTWMRASSSVSVIGARPGRASGLSEGDIGGGALGGGETFGRASRFVPARVRADSHAKARRRRGVEIGDEGIVAGGGESGPNRLGLLTLPEGSHLNGVARAPRLRRRCWR